MARFHFCGVRSWRAWLTVTTVIGTGLVGAASESAPSTWCNPLPIPDYPVGRGVRSVPNGSDTGGDTLWLSPRTEQYRELADPSALWFEGNWYLYPSCDLAWVSADEGLTWQHHPLNVRDVGYAPTVVRHQGRFLLLASDSDLYAAKSPLGPFEKQGPIAIPRDSGAPGLGDPMLFADDDGRLFLYWGCSQIAGIWVMPLSKDDPRRPAGPAVKAVPFDPASQPWECVGNWNQNPNTAWIEGSWMVKINGRYYLTYSSGGTENRTYAMGCYVADNPLGPFRPQRRNPILRSPAGLVSGTGHGCIVAGPRDSLWAFYTIRAGVAHGFERRIGMDLAHLDAEGELYVPEATSVPQRLPESVRTMETAAGWLPLNDGTRTVGSTDAPNLVGRYATDNSLTTWWQPAANDATPMLTSQLLARAKVRAVRIAWRDIGLDLTKGIAPGPFRYRVEAEMSPNHWSTIVDRSDSHDDLLVDYRETVPTDATRVRLVIVGAPAGITPGVAEFTVFGRILKSDE